MLDISIHDFSIVFYEQPQGDNFGEIISSKLNKPIILRLDRFSSNKYGLLHMELINGNENIQTSFNEKIKNANLSFDEKNLFTLLATGFSEKIILMNEVTKKKLLQNEIDAMCVLYHELGHLVYYDDSIHVGPEKRNKLIENGELSLDEILADEYSYQKYGIKVLTTLNKEINIAKKANDNSLRNMIKEYQLRIDYLNKKYYS